MHLHSTRKYHQRRTPATTSQETRATHLPEHACQSLAKPGSYNSGADEVNGDGWKRTFDLSSVKGSLGSIKSQMGARICRRPIAALVVRARGVLHDHNGADGLLAQGLHRRHRLALTISMRAGSRQGRSHAVDRLVAPSAGQRCRTSSSRHCAGSAVKANAMPRGLPGARGEPNASLML
mmetsp:Transcript_37444/g.113032  ORF Transcript_37444/g.113032 Transcript_37444/m.113032 type:complete len:179 (+) Transcript_37444:86-622(+)